MSDLGDFLLARIAEDERRLGLPDYDVVLNSHGEVSARGDGWVTRGDCPVCGAYMFDGTEAVTEEAWWEHAETVHQRRRVLAECEAKRRIVERESGRRVPKPGVPAVEFRTWGDGLVQVNGDFMPEAEFNERFTEPAPPSETLRLLALPYADHPDWREEWRL